MNMHIIVGHANVVVHGWMLKSICTLKKKVVLPCSIATSRGL